MERDGNETVLDEGQYSLGLALCSHGLSNDLFRSHSTMATVTLLLRAVWYSIIGGSPDALFLFEQHHTPDLLKNFNRLLAKRHPQVVIWLSRAYCMLHEADPRVSWMLTW